MFVANESRNADEVTAPDFEALGIEPLSTRSIILSVLLGTHPPQLSGQQLIGLGNLFGIRPGTTRTALSRMATSGELAANDGNYSLGFRLQQRQRQQDASRRRPLTSWDGRWFTVIAIPDRRPMAERRFFRAAMTGARMGELRPDVWMRPANIAPPDQPEDALLQRGELRADDPKALVAQLWPLAEINQRSDRLRSTLEGHRSSLHNDNPDHLRTAFLLSAAAIRFLRVEPQLPDELEPDSWTPPQLRPVYDDFEIAFQHQLQTFLSCIS